MANSTLTVNRWYMFAVNGWNIIGVNRRYIDGCYLTPDSYDYHTLFGDRDHTILLQWQMYVMP